MSYLLSTKLHYLSSPLLSRNLRSFSSINDRLGRYFNQNRKINGDPNPQSPKPDNDGKTENPSSFTQETDTEYLERLHFGFDDRTKINGEEIQAEQEWNGEPQSAEEIFNKMKETGLIPNAVTMLDALCRDGLREEAFKLIVLVRDEGMIPRVVIHTAAVEGFCRAHRFDDAIRVFKKMKSSGVIPNAITYQVLIRGLCAGRRLEDAYEYCIEMLEAGHRPNLATFTGLVDVYCREKDVEEAQDVIAALKVKGFLVEVRAVREYLDKKGPFSPLVRDAILGKKA